MWGHQDKPGGFYVSWKTARVAPFCSSKKKDRPIINDQDRLERASLRFSSPKVPCLSRSALNQSTRRLASHDQHCRQTQYPKWNLRPNLQNFLPKLPPISAISTMATTARHARSHPHTCRPQRTGYITGQAWTVVSCLTFGLWGCFKIGLCQIKTRILFRVNLLLPPKCYIAANFDHLGYK